jgi:hypothetical protein
MSKVCIAEKASGLFVLRSVILPEMINRLFGTTFFEIMLFWAEMAEQNSKRAIERIKCLSMRV